MTHCTKCGNNWAQLHSIADEANDELYEFCPVCRTDSFLTEGTGPAYILTIDNKIVNVATGKELIKESEVIEQQQKEPYYLIMQRKEREMEQKENEALEAYHNLFETDKVKAKEAYKNTWINYTK